MAEKQKRKEIIEIAEKAESELKALSITVRRRGGRLAIFEIRPVCEVGNSVVGGYISDKRFNEGATFRKFLIKEIHQASILKD
jgi:hypothetical protein